MTIFYIYLFDTDEQQPITGSGYQSCITCAKSELDALKKWYIYLRGNRGPSSFWRNATFYVSNNELSYDEN